MQDNPGWTESIICTVPTRRSLGLIQCGTERLINAQCPNEENHFKVQCPTCESKHPTMHPALQADGGEVQVCRDPWHSSTHQGREMMNKLVGHAYYDQVPELGMTHCPDCGCTRSAELACESSWHVSGDTTKYPEDPEREARRRASGRTEVPIAGAERGEESLPGSSGVSGPPDPSQVVLDDLGYAYAAMKRAQESIKSYTRLLAMLKTEEAAASAGKVPDVAEIALTDKMQPKQPKQPKHGQLATIMGVPGMILVYLSEMYPVDGPGWYPIGEQAIGNLVEDATESSSPFVPGKDREPVFYHDRQGNCINHQPGELVGCKFPDEVGHKARSDQARADFYAAQETYESMGEAFDAPFDAAMTPGGTRPVEHGELGGHEMPGMWDASDVKGGQEDSVRVQEPYERFLKMRLAHEYEQRGLDNLDLKYATRIEIIQALRADDIDKKARAQRQAEEAQDGEV